MSRLKKMNGLLAKRIPALAVCAGRLVVTPTDDVYRSFLIDTTSERNLVYVVAAVAPLYSYLPATALNFGNRLNGPVTGKFYINPDRYEESADIIAEAISAEMPRLKQVTKASSFLEYISWRVGSRTPNVMLQFALTHYRIGNQKEAARIFADVRPALEDQMPVNRVRFETLLAQIERELANGPQGLEQLMEEWKVANIALCDISSTLRAPLAVATALGT
jgi:hypothetical protein